MPRAQLSVGLIGCEIEQPAHEARLPSADAAVDHALLEFVRGDAPLSRPSDAFFHELGVDAAAVSERLSRATVAVVGLTGAGAEEPGTQLEMSEPATTASSTRPAISHPTGEGLFCDGGGGAVPRDRSSRYTSRAVCQRSSGSLANARQTM